LLNDVGRMHESLWWFLYITLLNEESRRKKEILDIINSLLPWFNFDLWKAAKDAEASNQNAAFSQQFKAAMQGKYDMPLDELFVGESDIPDDYFKQLFEQPGSSGQPTSTIKDYLGKNKE